MWICEAYGREFVANTEDGCFDLLEEFELSVPAEDLEIFASPELVEG